MQDPNDPRWAMFAKWRQDRADQCWADEQAHRCRPRPGLTLWAETLTAAIGVVGTILALFAVGVS